MARRKIPPSLQQYIDEFRAWAKRTVIVPTDGDPRPLHERIRADANRDLPDTVTNELYRDALRGWADAVERLLAIENERLTELQIELIKALPRRAGRFPRFRAPKTDYLGGRPRDLSEKGLRQLLTDLEAVKVNARREGRKGNITFRELLRPAAEHFAKDDKHKKSRAH